MVLAYTPINRDRHIYTHTHTHRDNVIAIFAPTYCDVGADG